MTECCGTCKYCLTIEKWDYSDVRHKGVPKEKEKGYACLIFAHEGICVHMVGCNENAEMCECYMERENNA